MRESLRWLGCLVAMAIVTAAILFAYFRWRGPSVEQRAAMAELAIDREPKEGRNGFATYWFLEYDVAPDAMDARLRDEVTSPPPTAEASGVVTRKPQATKLAEAGADFSGLCARDGSGCVAKAIADPDAMARAVDAFPVERAREPLVDAATFLWNPFPGEGLDRGLLSAFDVPRVWTSALAVQYARGDRRNALAASCHEIAMWRRLHRGTNSRTVELWTVTNAGAALHLFADMLAGFPAGEAVPDECEAALAPIVAADVDRCAIEAREIAMTDATFRRAVDASTKGASNTNGPLLDPEHARGLRAEIAARHCGADAIARLLRDELDDADATPPILHHRLECIADFAGCTLAEMSRSLMPDVDRTTINLAAWLRLGATLLWLRAGDADASPAERFAARPASMRSGIRESGVDPAKNVIFVEMRRTSGTTRFELALAPPAH